MSKLIKIFQTAFITPSSFYPNHRPPCGLRSLDPTSDVLWWGSKSWMCILGRLGEEGRLSSLLRCLGPAAPSLVKTGEQGREAESLRTSVPLVLARAWGSGLLRFPVNPNWPFSLVGLGEARGELGLLYSLIPSGNSLKSGQITRDSWDRPAGDFDRDLGFGLDRDLFQDDAEDWGLGRDLVWCPAGLSSLSLWSSGLYILSIVEFWRYYCYYLHSMNQKTDGERHFCGTQPFYSGVGLDKEAFWWGDANHWWDAQLESCILLSVLGIFLPSFSNVISFRAALLFLTHIWIDDHLFISSSLLSHQNRTLSLW